MNRWIFERGRTETKKEGKKEGGKGKENIQIPENHIIFVILMT